MPSPAIHILGISGSLRKASYNTRLLRIAADLLSDGVTLEIADLAPLPMYNSDLQERSFPAPVEHFRTQIANADALLISTPEYNHSITGALKNAIDWASRAPIGAPPGTRSPLYGKPAAIMGVGGRSGTHHAQIHLRQIVAHTHMLVLDSPELLISNSQSRAFDSEGNLIDTVAAGLLEELLTNLVALARQTKLGHESAEAASV